MGSLGSIHSVPEAIPRRFESCLGLLQAKQRLQQRVCISKYSNEAGRKRAVVAWRGIV
jgi:hypothetical protein